VRASRSVPDPSIERFGTASAGAYVVRRGDTLGGIAQRNRTTVSAIKRANGMRTEKIIAGQRLRIPG
jgi:LysM repeat protein